MVSCRNMLKSVLVAIVLVSWNESGLAGKIKFKINKPKLLY